MICQAGNKITVERIYSLILNLGFRKGGHAAICPETRFHFLEFRLLRQKSY